MKIFKKLDDRAFEVRAHVALYITAVIDGVISVARYAYRRFKCS